MKHYLYIIRCKNNHLYIGISKNPANRFTKHIKGQGAKFTFKYKPIAIVYHESYNSYEEARKREIQIKKWRREKKENLIKYGKPNIKKTNICKEDTEKNNPKKA